MEENKNYQIYALTSNGYVYVGKSTGKDLNSIRWRHLRGENKQTRSYFSKAVAPDLKVHLLTTAYTNRREAYRYVVAFARMFLNSGHILLNSHGIAEDALDLYPATAQLLNRLETVPLQKWLDGTSAEHSEVLPCVTSGTNNPKKRTAPVASESITMRVFPDEKHYFKEAAQEAGVSQHQFFRMLLEQHKYRNQESPDWSCVDYVRAFMRGYKERIAKQEEEISALKEQLKQQTQAEKTTLKTREVLSRDGIRKFFQYFNPSNSGSRLLPAGYYWRFLKTQPDAARYQYPVTEGFFLFRPAFILQGNGHYGARFIAGTDENGRKTLLRYYPRAHYTGFSFTNERFGLEGSLWLVRAERSNDGAMDVVFGLPLDIVRKEHTSEEEEEYASDIDAIIADAVQQSKQDDFESLFRNF